MFNIFVQMLRIRAVVPEDAYASRKMDDIPLKILREKSEHPIAKALTSCLTGQLFRYFRTVGMWWREYDLAKK